VDPDGDSHDDDDNDRPTPPRRRAPPPAMSVAATQTLLEEDPLIHEVDDLSRASAAVMDPSALVRRGAGEVAAMLRATSRHSSRPVSGADPRRFDQTGVSVEDMLTTTDDANPPLWRYADRSQSDSWARAPVTSSPTRPPSPVVRLLLKTGLRASERAAAVRGWHSTQVADPAAKLARLQADIDKFGESF
jgi:hypothetical protein